MSRERELSNHVRSVLRGGASWAECLRSLAHTELPERHSVHVALVQTRRDGAQPHAVRGISLDSEALDGEAYELRLHSDDRRAVSHLRYQRIRKDVGLFLGVLPGVVWREDVDRLIDGQYPTLFRPFLRQGDFVEILRKIDASLGDGRHLRIRKISSIRKNPQARSSFDSNVCWTDQDLKTTFAEAVELRQYFRRVSFRVCRAKKDGSGSIETDEGGSVTRSAHFSANGDVDLMLGVALTAALGRVESDRAISTDRTRSLDTSVLPKPLVAQLPAGVSLSSADMPSMARLLRRYPKASVSVLHANPYLHATMVDMLDGSSFDLWIASATRITIVPQIRSSEAAMTRLCQFIYDQIGEVEFADAAEGPI